MHFRSIADLSNDVYKKLLPRIAPDIDVVIGIPRSGMLVATMLSTAIGARLGIVNGNSFIGARGENIVLSKNGKTLLVDDSIHSGRALRTVLSNIDRLELDLQICVAYAHSKSVHLVDYFASVLDGARVFQWNFTGTKATREFCWDLDGVICTNPKVYDDDGEHYESELRNGVKPLFLPQVPIKAIVTNRIERWRDITQAWLQTHGVEYAELIMQPYDTAVARRRNSNSADFKAEKLDSTGGTLFVESSDNQANKIARLSGKPVISIEKMCLYEYK